MGKKRQHREENKDSTNASPKKSKTEEIVPAKPKVQTSKDLLMKKFDKINVLGVDCNTTQKSSEPRKKDSHTDINNEKQSQTPKEKNKKDKHSADNSIITNTINDDTVLEEKRKKKMKHKKEQNDDVIESVEDTLEGEERLDPEVIEMRKRKREKRRQKKLNKEKRKQESADKAGTGGAMAVEYLKQWDTDRDNWKFMKVRQVWLLQNMFDCSQIDDETFEILLRYLEPLKGKSREASVETAEKIMNEEADKDDSDTNTTKEDRAKEIIQLLS